MGRRARRGHGRRSPTSSSPTSSKLETKVDAASYQPAQLANGAVELLDEVSKSKITGEEERYSHTDLVDFEANVDGAQQAVRAAAAGAGPRERRRWRARVERALRRRRRGARALPARRDASSTTRPSTGAAAQLSQAVDALAEPLSQVGGHDRRELMALTRRALLGAGAASGSPRPAGCRGGVGSSPWRTRTAASRASRSRSTARTRPGSPRRPRTGCTSPPSTSSPTTATSRARPAARLDGRRRAHDRGAPGRARPTPTRWLPPIDTGEAVGLRARAADHHGRASARRCSTTASAWRRAARAALADLPPLPGDELDPERSRRRPLRPGLRGRPAGRLPRRPQPRAHRPRRRW